MNLYIEELENIQVLACRLFLGIRRTSLNNICGRYPLSVNVAINKVKYWLRVIKMNEDIIPYYYCLQLSESHARRGDPNCFTCVHKCLCNSGCGYVWLSKSCEVSHYG